MPTFPHPPLNPSSPFASMTAPHVAVRVPNFEEGKRWYIDKLDFRPVYEWPFGELTLAYLAPPNDDGFWVELLGGGAPVARPKNADLAESLHAAGYHHFCLTVANVDAAVAELRRRGVTVLGEPFVLETISRKLAFFEDPWGNLIELAEVLR